MSTEEFKKDWLTLTNHLNINYYKPDIEALRIILCTFLTHFYYTSPAVWLCLVGAPGSGKTEIGLRPLEKFPSVHAISELTTNSFLSGFGDKNGILDKLTPISSSIGKSLGTHGILVFPDFTTTLLSKDQFTRAEIMGQMRRVYDGCFEKKTGNKVKMMEWKGKVTCIAAATPDIEEHWATYRDMGERWLNLRWRGHNDTYEDRKVLSQFAEKQEGREQIIRSTLNQHIEQLIENISSGPQGSFNSEELTASAILLEECRVNVKREFVGKGLQVTGLGNKQYSTRTPKSLGLIAKASASLRRDDQIKAIDIQLAKRVAIDSIPSKRLKVLEILCSIYPDGLNKGELIEASKIARSSFERILEDMRHLHLIEISQSPNAGTAIDRYELDEQREEGEIWENNPYHFIKVKSTANIRLHKNIIPVLKDAKLIT